MFGEDYFKTRHRLTDVVLQVIELAKKTEADTKPLLESDFTKGLSNPFLFTVCGEPNAGKSTLFNGLFGKDICEVNVDNTPKVNRVQWYRNDGRAYDKEVTPVLQECYRPVDFLTNFHLVDTPGTSSTENECSQVTQRFLPVADLVFWVFPASNPWAAATWDFISKQDIEVLDKSILIIQKTDLHDEQDISIILGHVSDLAKKRIGFVPPIFTVSGKKAVESKQGKALDKGLWQESGFPNLEQYIADFVKNSSVRRQLLVNIHHATEQVMRNIEETVENRSRLLESNEGFLYDIEAEVDQERDKQSSDFAGKFSNMREAFVSQSVPLRTVTKRQLSVFPTLKSFFSTENVSKLIESSLIASVKSAVEEQAEDDGKHFVGECRRHWETVRPRVKERLAVSLQDFDTETSGFEEARERFVTRMGRAARQAVVNLRIRSGFDMQLADRRVHLRKWLYGALLLLMLSGITGAMRLGPDPYPAFVLLALSLGCLVGFVLRTLATRMEITNSFDERLQDSRIAFTDALEDDYREGVRDFYVEYGRLLGSVRKNISDAKMDLQPNLVQWNGLFLQLKEIEQEL